MGGRRFAWFGGLALALGAGCACGQETSPSATSPEGMNADIQTYLDAVAAIERKGLLIDPTASRDRIIAATLKAYLSEVDPFGDFLTADEYAQFKRVQAEKYAGIGLELERGHDGVVLCFPEPAGPAARAGVVAGDRLVSIDGHPVGALALPTLAAMAAGPSGSTLSLEVLRHGKHPKHLQVVRSEVRGPSVSVSRTGARPVIRIAGFSRDTRPELEFALSQSPASEPLILDLRGNRGGDLNAAIDSAMLFLGVGDTIVSVRGKDGSHSYSSSIGKSGGNRQVFLWQDSGTASAAEVFVAALTENGRGVSIGARTYGKGTKQDIIELRSGAALILTTGYLLTPRGHEIDGRGLAPTYPVVGTGSGAAALLEKVNQLSP